MQIKQIDPIVINQSMKKDSVDVPDCFGEFNKNNKLCSKYCAISVRCCVLTSQSPKIDILERLLDQDQFVVKLH